MTPEQKAAFIVASAAILTGRIAAMQAANQQRVATSQFQLYSEQDFIRLVDESACGHNSVVDFFRDV